MTYDEFKQAWSRALHDSGLPHVGAREGKETLDLRSMDRTFESYVEPLGGQDAGPFHVAATLSWRWDSFLTARTATTEEDMLSELIGREKAHEVQTEPSWLRVDVKLHASLLHGKPIPMPAPSVWAKWTREVRGRLEKFEPLVPEEGVREGRDGRLEILAWQEEPVAKVVCGAGGELKLQQIKLSAGQVIELPRRWDDSAREADEHPARQLQELFERLRPALHAWMEVMDHLVPLRASE